MSMKDVREEYHAKELSEQDLLADPLAQAKVWVNDAIAANLPLPNAMMLATVSPKGQPSSRVVLLKDINASGFTFFTHYKSRKGLELEANPQVSFVMFWPAFDRQLVVMGRTEKTTADVSRNYFASRPRGSQISALASPQSEPTDRAWLEQQVGTLTKRYPEGSAVPVPENWGGYLVRPTEIQFWHGRPNRLHDRFRYLKQADGDWQRQRLAP